MVNQFSWFNHREREKGMKKIMALLLAGTLLIGTASFAQQESSIRATFYDGIPSATGALVTDDFGQTVEVTLVSNAIGQKIENLEEAKYVDVQFAGETLVFKLFGGDTTNEMTLLASTNPPSGEDGTTISLGQVTALLSNALNSDQHVAIFKDGDGVVQGFYTYSTTNFPTITVKDAETLTLLSKAGAETFQTTDPGTVKLESVLILQGEEYVPLKRIATFEQAL
jgi:hypothetical protein